MRLLLDTHIWLFVLMEPDRIGARLRRTLDSLDQPPRVSPVSVWEAMMLAEKGRIRLDPDPQRWLARARKAVPVREAPFTFEVAMVSRSLRLDHQDPADRFLAATAKVLGLKLVTADEKLLRCPDIEVLANR